MSYPKTGPPTACVKKKVYIAGPMRGIKYYNFPAFDDAADRLDDEGYEPVSPAELDRDAGFDPYDLPEDHDWSTLPEGLILDSVIKRDLSALSKCDAIYLLPGWQQSLGARCEKAYAEWMGLQIIYPEERIPGNRKEYPIASGVLDYFPDALVAVAHVSKVGNDQHNPGQPLHWSKDKSTDHADCLLRHMLDRGTLDTDGVRHSAKVAWRALALLQTEIEQDIK